MKWVKLQKNKSNAISPCNAPLTNGGITEHLDGLVRKSVKDTLNTLLNEEADVVCHASRYQRSPDRQDTRAGTYKRKSV